jgi:hypothetical protein
MVQAGISPEVLDRMELEDLFGWCEVMAVYNRELDKLRPGGKP